MINQAAIHEHNEWDINPIKARKYTKMDSPRHCGSSSTPVKRVRFSDMSTLILTQPKSNEELCDSWYTKRDVALFKQNIRHATNVLRETRTAKAMKHVAYSIASNTPQSPINFHGSGSAIVGLEHLLSPEVLKLLFQRRRLTAARVIEEQAVQSSLGENDAERIAQVSKDNSAFTREWALRIPSLQE